MPVCCPTFELRSCAAYQIIAANLIRAVRTVSRGRKIDWLIAAEAVRAAVDYTYIAGRARVKHVARLDGRSRTHLHGTLQCQQSNARSEKPTENPLIDIKGEELPNSTLLKRGRDERESPESEADRADKRAKLGLARDSIKRDMFDAPPNDTLDRKPDVETVTGADCVHAAHCALPRTEFTL